MSDPYKEAQRRLRNYKKYLKKIKIPRRLLAIRRNIHYRRNYFKFRLEALTRQKMFYPIPISTKSIIHC